MNKTKNSKNHPITSFIYKTNDKKEDPFKMEE